MTISKDDLIDGLRHYASDTTCGLSDKQVDNIVKRIHICTTDRPNVKEEPKPVEQVEEIEEEPKKPKKKKAKKIVVYVSLIAVTQAALICDRIATEWYGGIDNLIARVLL